MIIRVRREPSVRPSDAVYVAASTYTTVVVIVKSVPLDVTDFKRQLTLVTLTVARRARAPSLAHTGNTFVFTSAAVA